METITQMKAYIPMNVLVEQIVVAKQGSIPITVE